MRVLFLSPSLGIGGSEALTVSYAKGMQARGHEVAVVYGADDSRVPELTRAGIDPIRVSDRFLKGPSLLAWRRALKKVVGDVRPDVIHAQSVTAALVARLAAPRTPLLVTLHGIENEEREPLAALVLRAVRGRVTAVSERAALAIGRYWLAPGIEVLPGGIDIDEIERRAAAPPRPGSRGKPHFCCVARQQPIKGVDVLVRAFALVHDALPQATLTFVGGGVALTRNRHMAAELGLTDRVDFTGQVGNALPYIREADIVVLPSRREGLPLTALESLALGRPVIATAVGGTPTVVRDGETGWLVPPEDERALADAMIDAGRDLDQARQRGRAGRALMKDRFTADRLLDRIEELLVQAARRDTDASRRSKTPPLKPKPYYVATRSYQKARIARARLTKRASGWEGIRLIGYHRVSEANDALAVKPGQFRSHIESLVESGIAPISLEHALALLERPVSGRYACVTFDDAFRDIATNAMPILREYGVPATIFAPTAIVDGRATYSWYRRPPPALTWDELRELVSDPLFDVQAHSRTHPRLPALSTERASEEILGSKLDIEQRLGRAVTSFCYPAGIYCARDVQLVNDAGYRAGITTRTGANRGGGPMGELRRTMISWHDTRVDFEAKLSGLLDSSSSIEQWVQRRRAEAGRSMDS